MKGAVFLFAWLTLAVVCKADSVQTPYHKATPSSMGTAVFAMVPILQGSEVKLGDGRGIMYALRVDGTFEKQWEVSGWYSHSVIPSDNAEFLVRIGDWPEGDRPKKEDLAVALYRRGKLIRSYSTLELIIDRTKIKRSASHYWWLADGARSYIYGTTFVLTTSDLRCIVFDLESGSIAKVYEPGSKGSKAP